MLYSDCTATSEVLLSANRYSAFSSKMSLAVTLAAVFLSIALPLVLAPALSIPVSHSIEEEDVKVDIHITVPESDE